ncbi:Uma2 family endonuclease [Nocardiopsis algeriensis]|uniref:Uma2 family endonuclease n=1 Tax=Nocardiopsis algeriensis TaxID=1478215 RepID=UPI003B4324EF
MAIRHADAAGGRLTVDDLARLPDDGRRHELVDGRLEVSPAPVFRHFRAANRLSTHLDILSGGEFELGENPGMTLNAEGTHHRVPDLAVFDHPPASDGYFDAPPLLAVEIVSPESVIRDTHTKRQEYAAFGIPSYWIINPLADKVGLVELQLEEGRYQEVTLAHGEDVFETELPFPIKLVPHWLTADGPWMKHIGGGSRASGRR